MPIGLPPLPHIASEDDDMQALLFYVARLHQSFSDIVTTLLEGNAALFAVLDDIVTVDNAEVVIDSFGNVVTL